MCEHHFEYAGVRYCDGVWPLPGTGARQRYYAHVYFCVKCVETKGEPITRSNWNTYEEIKFGATPGTADQCGVHLRDR